jgi:dihydroxyacid dehydratase/phosphogluconate dehydratase
MATNIRTYSSAATPHASRPRRGLEDHADLHRRIDDESVAIDENSVLVLKQGGPHGAPGMAEWRRAQPDAAPQAHAQANEGVDFAR